MSTVSSVSGVSGASSVSLRPPASDLTSGFVGIDVSKAKLDVHARGRDFSVGNDAAGIRQLINRLGKTPSAEPASEWKNR